MWVCVREVEVDAGPGEDPVPRRDRREGFRGASAGVCALSVSASDADSGGLAWDRSGGALPASEARRVRRFVAALGRGDLTTTGDRRAPPPPALFLLAGPASAVGGGGGARAAALVAALVAAEDGDATRACASRRSRRRTRRTRRAPLTSPTKRKENVADARVRARGRGTRRSSAAFGGRRARRPAGARRDSRGSATSSPTRSSFRRRPPPLGVGILPFLLLP